MNGIIVGLDDSIHSCSALRWAIYEAAIRHLPLTVVTVVPEEIRPATTIYWGLPTYPEDHRNQELARKTIQQRVGEITNEIGANLPEVTVSVTKGNPAEELIKAARSADMLVVGSRGSGGFSTLLMGSVSTQVTHHAKCPVVVIREPHPGS
jgi:nucleotide-binding universal stress UspA family protein